MGYFSDLALNMTLGDVRDDQRLDALDGLPRREPGDRRVYLYDRATERAIEEAGKAAAVEAAAEAGIRVGTVVRRKGSTAARGTGTGVVVNLWSQCAHAVRAHTSNRRSQCTYKPRPYVGVRWVVGRTWGGDAIERTTGVPLATVERI